MNELEYKLVALIKSAVKEKYDVEPEDSMVMVEIPKDKSNGDYSTNIAMRMAKSLKAAPVMIANGLKPILENSDLVEKVEVAGPGFINFTVNKGELTQVISKIITLNDKYGDSDKYSDIKLCCEYVSVNPTGDIHPGHARGAAVGDSLTRMMKKLGYKVTREYYVNDAGNQIDNLGKSIFVRYHELFNVEMAMPEDGYHAKDIYDIAQKVKDEYGDKYLNVEYKDEVREFFKEFGTKFELDKLKKDLDLYRVNFDVWTSEKTLYERKLVEEALDKLDKNGMLYEAEGATWLKTTNWNDDKDRVIKKTDGSYTYLTPDIAYHLDKFNRDHEYLIDILGADHHGYIPRLKAAIGALGYKPENLDVIIIQMVRLIKDGEEFKLSKRSGKAIALRDIIEEAGVDATRYYFVSKAPNTQMDFDIDMATKKSNDNPVYYVQYAHARMCSILSNEIKYELKNSYDLIKEEKETLLIKHLNEFPAAIEECVSYKEPHRMCNYVYKLAQLFHSFYNECKVIDSNNLELTHQRLALVKACQITLSNALDLIGVSAPEKM